MSASLSSCTAPSAPSFFLRSTPTYRVHPLVVFSILDHYQRRNVGQVRVVGTLLGVQHGNGVIEVKQAFPVPHQEEEDSAAVEIDYHQSMMQLYKQVAPKDVVVGWYSTSGSNESGEDSKAAAAPTAEQQNYITSLLHEVYRQQMANSPSTQHIEPLHLNVDVSLKGGMKVNGFIGQMVKNKTAAAAATAAAATPAADLLASFHPVPVTLYAYEEEKLGVDALISGVPDDVERLDAPATFLTDAENIEQDVIKLLESMESVEGYIEKVVAGKIEQPDASLAVQIHQLLAALPTLDQATFQSTFSTHIQDLLSIVYLANMTKNQLAIADKANVLV